MKGRGFEPHRRHCVVSLSKNINPSLVLVQPRKTRPLVTERLLMGCKELNHTKQNFPPSTQHRATNGPPVVRHLNGLSFVGRWWPAGYRIEILHVTLVNILPRG